MITTPNATPIASFRFGSPVGSVKRWTKRPEGILLARTLILVIRGMAVIAVAVTLLRGDPHVITHDRALLIAGLGVGACIAAVIVLNGFVLALGIVLLLVAWYLHH